MLLLLLACTEECTPRSWYADADGDGFGAGSPEKSCDGGEGRVETGDDCDDADPGVHPGADEACDGADQDCDGEADEGLGTTWFLDDDGDSWGDPEHAVEACEAPPTYVAEGGDCDDADETVHPGVTEFCDGVDQDCDGEVDDFAADATTWHEDADTDGFGDPEAAQVACEAPAGWVADAEDCDDANATIAPGAPEHCDEVDEDCDGEVDEDAVDATAWFADDDGDGAVDDGDGIWACEAPEGYGSGPTDCDDQDAANFPGNDEICDEQDNDCDGESDEDPSDASLWYADFDGDGYGWDEVWDCGGVGLVLTGGDCDDEDAAIHPGATEVAGDRVDDDCSGAIACWADLDLDGYGGSTTVDSTDSDCRDDGEDTDADDCDDGDADVHPWGTEVAYDGVDQDCDGADLGDVDGDGHDAVDVGGDDCDDADPAVNPGGTEICDTTGTDDDCDGLVNGDDPDISATETFYADLDLDGWGDEASATVSGCAPEGTVRLGGDCDDADDDVHPGAAESCEDAVDLNCDGLAGSDDHDGDGWAACEDCDDSDAAISPSGSEASGGGDEDCDGLVDEYVGDVELRSEADAEALCADWRSVEGDLDVEHLDGLDALSCLHAVSGDLRLSDIDAPSLAGLEALSWVGGALLVGGWQEESRLLDPSSFSSLDGLDRLRSVGGELWVAENQVADLGGLARLESVGGSITLWDLPITAVSLPVGSLGGDLWLEALPELGSVSAPALEALGGSLWLQSVGGSSGGFSLDWDLPIGGSLGLVGLAADADLGWVLPDTVGALYVDDTELADLDGLAGLRVVEGELALTDNPALTDLGGLDALESVGGDLGLIDLGATELEAFPALSSVGGSLRVDDEDLVRLGGFAALDSIGATLQISAGDLESVGGFDRISSCPSLVLSGASSLADASPLAKLPFHQDVSLSGLRALPDLSLLAAVTDLSGSLQVENSRGLVSLAGLEGLRSVGAALVLDDHQDLASAELPALESVGGALTLSECDVLTSLDVGALRSVGEDVAVADLPMLVAIDLGSLDSVGGIRLSGLDSLTEFPGLPALWTVGETLLLDSNPALVTLDGLEGVSSVGEDLIIRNNGALVDLEGLEGLASVGRDLTIQRNESLELLLGLGGLQAIGRDLWVEYNPDLGGLEGLGPTTVGNTVWLYENAALASVDGLEAVTTVPGHLVVYGSPVVDLVGLANLGAVGGTVRIGDCPALADLSGLDALQSVGGSVEIGYQASWSWGEPNSTMTSLDGLGGLQSIGDDLWIAMNPLLVDISALEGLRSVGGDLGVIYNDSLPTADAEALGDGTPTVGGVVYVYGNL